MRASMRVWVLPELDGHNSMPTGRQAGTVLPSGLSLCLPDSYRNGTHIGRLPVSSLPQVQLTLVENSVRLGEGYAPYVCPDPCLPAMPTHLGAFRFLQAEAASVDLALRLWVDLDELIALGVPAGLGGLWRALPGVREGLGSVQKADTRPSPTPLKISRHPLLAAHLQHTVPVPSAPTPTPPAVLRPGHSPLPVKSHSSPPPARAPGRSRCVPAEGQTAEDTPVSFTSF